jgi:hypothetical protein
MTPANGRQSPLGADRKSVPCPHNDTDINFPPVN